MFFKISDDVAFVLVLKTQHSTTVTKESFRVAKACEMFEKASPSTLFLDRCLRLSTSTKGVRANIIPMTGMHFISSRVVG